MNLLRLELTSYVLCASVYTEGLLSKIVRLFAGVKISCLRISTELFNLFVCFEVGELYEAVNRAVKYLEEHLRIHLCRLMETYVKCLAKFPREYRLSKFTRNVINVINHCSPSLACCFRLKYKNIVEFMLSFFQRPLKFKVMNFIKCY
jgi:dimeric dUTPase (all-alpha-NTP-PPase superfamily)